MGIEEAIIASSFIDCKNIVGCHYDTFPIIELDQKKAKSAFTSEGVDFTTSRSWGNHRHVASYIFKHFDKKRSKITKIWLKQLILA